MWILSNPRNVLKGHTLADMADDYAELIAQELNGKADLVIGHSTGGMIGLHPAARHPDRFGHIAVAGAACEWREELRAGNLEFVGLLAAGRKILPEIAVPVLLVGADQDFYVPRDILGETAQRILNCTYKLYRGKNHLQTTCSKQFRKDVLRFVQR